MGLTCTRENERGEGKKREENGEEKRRGGDGKKCLTQSTHNSTNFHTHYKILPD